MQVIFPASTCEFTCTYTIGHNLLLLIALGQVIGNKTNLSTIAAPFIHTDIGA